jgi:cyanophycinase
VAQNPYLHGIGIDEDTALVIALGASIEVIGNGSVTLVDGRDIISNVADASRRESLELIDVRLHMLPAGSRYRRPDTPASDLPVVPAPLHDLVNILTHKSAHHEDR